MRCPKCGNIDWIYIVDRGGENALRCLDCGHATSSRKHPGKFFKIYGTLTQNDLTEIIIANKILALCTLEAEK